MIMKKSKPLGLLLALLLPWGLAAQWAVVRGTVTDAETGDPLPGVEVMVKNTRQGTVTDFDGKYTLRDVPRQAVLIFKYLGYKTREIPVTGPVINLRMQPQAEQLKKVVVIGYGTAKKEDLTGAVDKLTPKDFAQGEVTSVQNLITGKVAGVTTIAPSGAPGEGASIYIRGLSSLSLTNEPLFVVNGIPLGRGIGGERNPLNAIDPNDIESIVVLKDASATAIYGARAANGVILITTKKAKGKGFHFDYSIKYTGSMPVSFVPVMNSLQFRQLVNDTGDAQAMALLGDASTNWQREIFRPANGVDHHFNATGRLWGVPVRLSLGHLDHDGILRNDNFQRSTLALNLVPEFWKGNLRLELNAQGNYTVNHFGNRGAIGAAIVFDPTQPVYDTSSPFGGYFSWIDPNTNLQYNLAPTNPVALVELTDDYAYIKRFIGNAKADFRLPFFKALTATLNVGWDRSFSKGHTIVSAQMPTSDASWQGIHNYYKNAQTNKLLNTYITYQPELKNHTLKWMAGYSYQMFDYSSDFYDDYAFQHGNPDYNKIDLSREVLLSYFTRLNYGYRGKYLLTASLRADASSLLNPRNRWGLFPSFALAWNIHKEKFMENSPFDELKLRLGYGAVGNVNGLAPYKYLTRYQISTSTAGYQFGNTFYQTYRPEPVNKDLRWEVGKTTNVGLDFSLWEHRLFGSLNWYRKQTDDLIIWALVDPFTNFGNRVEKNVGNMLNRGWELTLGAYLVRKPDWRWRVDYNLGINHNEITYMPFDQEVGGIEGGVGNTVQRHTEGAAPYSFYVYQQVYDADGRPIEGVYVDRNGDGVINSDDKYLFKDPYADVLMGLSTSLRYKRFDLSVSTRASIGNYMYNNVASSKSIPANLTGRPFLTNIHTDYYNTHFQNYTETNLLSDYYVQDASFFKVDNITLGYRFPEIYKHMRLRMFAAIQNVAVLTRYRGIDPEIAGGIDNNFYPRPRMFTFGLSVKY